MARLPDGRRLAEASASSLLAARVGRVIAVTRSDPELMAVLQNCGCEIVINERADQGMGTSIAAGVAASIDASGWLIALGDMPSIRVDTVTVVANALRSGARIVLPTMDGKRGHPVGFPGLYRTRLQSLSGDTGAREIVNAEANFVEEIRVDDAGIFFDIDTRADMKL